MSVAVAIFASKKLHYFNKFWFLSTFVCKHTSTCELMRTKSLSMFKTQYTFLTNHHGH